MDKEIGMAKIVSREITYRSIVEQIFFDDDGESELIIRTGWAENQPFDLDVEVEWVWEPEWAEGLSKDEVLKIAGGVLPYLDEEDEKED